MERSTPSPAADTREAEKPPRKANPAPRADVAAAPPPADPPRPAADKSASATSSVNIEAFAKNIARMVEQGGRALAAYLKPREEGRAGEDNADLVTDAVKTLSQVMEYWLARPHRPPHLPNIPGKSYLDPP